MIIKDHVLPIPAAFKFSPEQKQFLDGGIQYWEVFNRRHEFFTESDRQTMITDIISFALSFLDSIYVSNEFVIRPKLVYKKMKEGIERRVDCAIYNKTQTNIICLTEVKKDAMDIKQCLRQNADQLRAFCLCEKKNTMRGISTVGTDWIFT